MPTNHRQQFVHLAMPHTDTSKSNVKRESSRGYDLLRALGSACDITHEVGIRVVISHTSHGHDLSPC